MTVNFFTNFSHISSVRDPVIEACPIFDKISPHVPLQNSFRQSDFVSFDRSSGCAGSGTDI